MQTIKKLFWISRPVSWPNTAFPFAAGWLVSGGSLSVFFIVATVFFLIPYNLLMYGINDVFDYESDVKNPRKGGIEGMREERAFHPMILRVSLSISALFLVYLLLNGTLASNLMLALVIFLVIAYSAPLLRFKERAGIDSLTSSMHFVGPLLYALTFFSFTMEAWIVVSSFLLWGMASHALGAIQDINPDREAGIGSIAVSLSARPTLYLVALFYSASAGLLFLLDSPYNMVSFLLLLYVINLYDIRAVTTQNSATANGPWRRFIWLNLFVGFCITILLLLENL